MRVKNWVLSGLLFAFLAASLTAVSRRSDEKSLNPTQRALHVLNRFTFGPRPEEVQQVAAMGVDKWFEQQLHPEKIDDSALDARLEPFRTLRMDARTLLEDFPPPQLVRAVADGRQPMPSDPQERAIYEAQIARYRQRAEAKQANTAGAPGLPASGRPGSSTGDTQLQMQEERREARSQAEQLLDEPADQRFRQILQLAPEEQQKIANVLKPQERMQLFDGLTPQQRETVMALANPQAVLQTEMTQAKLLRAIYSQRELQEVMTDFWFNHFNVFIGKGPERYWLSSYERDVIRPHALGKFQDLLVAVAQSPAMLFYLDNWQSVGPDSDFARYGPQGPRRNAAFRPRRMGPPFPRRAGFPQFPRFPSPPAGQQRKKPQQQAQNRPTGLNENYARELMELHTLGVNGGYTQNDVIQVAKVLSGWTIRPPRQGGGFQFDERRHEPGTKIVLGHKIKQNGEKEGLQLLSLLAHSPATAHFLSKELAMRFVADDPPPALVDRMAHTFLKKDGDIREVLRTMYRSPEFWAPDAMHAKVKTPLEFVVSAIRATGADVENAMPLVGLLNRMGMPLYGDQPPNGYSMVASAWVNSSALIDRLNFSLALGTGHVPGVKVDPQQLVGGQQPSDDAQAVLTTVESRLLNGQVSAQTHDSISKRLDDPEITRRRLDDPARPPNVGIIAGLLLGSPEFQRR